ncbi:hypothetical protein [Variovorax sp. LjRoot178]|uniref:hypothetical protein n=1 Tax=Variovorax sp. LjRoot178 TaxID=3342277 RepID=UPI003ECE7A0C
MTNAAMSDHFNPLRYWSDRPDFMAHFDAVDAQLDREDSLSERNAFLLGCDLGQRRLDPAKDSEGRVSWPHPEMERGYAHGLGLQAQRADAYLRKLLGLKVRAFARGIPVSSALTVSFLRSITVAVCPVSGATLTQGTLTGTDWSIDRLDNSLGYVPGNVAMMSARVNLLKGEAEFEALAADALSTVTRLGPDGFAAELQSGLKVLEAFRLAALMAAPSGFTRGVLARYSPFAMAPGAWATLDSVVAGIHVECARGPGRGSAEARRTALFKRLGANGWRLSNCLVVAIRTSLALGTHPADIWFEGDTLELLSDLMDSFMSDPPVLEHIDPEMLSQAMNIGLEPVGRYVR